MTVEAVTLGCVSCKMGGAGTTGSKMRLARRCIQREGLVDTPRVPESHDALELGQEDTKNNCSSRQLTPYSVL